MRTYGESNECYELRSPEDPLSHLTGQTFVRPSMASAIRGGGIGIIQAALAQRGYYRGPIDGVWGPETRNAIRSFQAHRGLPVTGPAVWTFPTPPNSVGFSGRSGLNHGGVAQNVCPIALAQGLGFNLFTHECDQVQAGGTSSGPAPLG